MSEIETVEEVRSRRVLLVVVGLTLVIVAVAVGMWLTRTPAWEVEYRAYVQETIIDDPEFFDGCASMHLFGLTADKVAAMALAQGGKFFEENPERAEEMAQIGGGMVAEACGL